MREFADFGGNDITSALKRLATERNCYSQISVQTAEYSEKANK